MAEKPPQCAIKVLSRSILRRKRVGRNGSAYDSVLGEIAIMKHLRHPNAVRLYEVIDDPDEDLLFMCMELVKGGDLSEPVTQKRVVPEDEMRGWLRGITLGLEHLHLCGVCHRDIKPENLLWDPVSRQAKLSDFGISGFFRATSLGGDFFSATQGSLAFFAPEMCRTIKGAGYSGRAADLWALGVCMYMWIYWEVPFPSDNPPALLKSIVEDEIVYPPKEEAAPSPALLALVASLLRKLPAERSRIKDLRRDDFLTKGGTEPLDEPLPAHSAIDGNVVVPRSALASAIQRITILNHGGATAMHDGVDYSLDYELAARTNVQEELGEQDQDELAHKVSSRQESFEQRAEAAPVEATAQEAPAEEAGVADDACT